MDVLPAPGPFPYEVRIQRVDADRCLVTFLETALPASAARRLPLDARLACKAVVYVFRRQADVHAEALYRRDPDGTHLPPDYFPQEALALVRGFLDA